LRQRNLKKADFFDMERRWLSLAHSYEFAERLSDFSRSMRKQKGSSIRV
jgi:hypothetical protein